MTDLKPWEVPPPATTVNTVVADNIVIEEQVAAPEPAEVSYHTFTNLVEVSNTIYNGDSIQQASYIELDPIQTGVIASDQIVAGTIDGDMVLQYSPVPTNTEVMNQIANQLDQQPHVDVEEIPQEELYQGHVKSILIKIFRWFKVKKEMAELKAEESELRQAIISSYFAKPKKDEGTERRDLPDNWKLSAKFGLDRKVDETILDSVFAELPEGSKDRLIRYKPEVNIKAYRELTETQRAIFDKALIIKPESVQVTLEPPKPPKEA